MKKLMTLALGLSLFSGSAVFAAGRPGPAPRGRNDARDNRGRNNARRDNHNNARRDDHRGAGRNDGRKR